MGHHLEMELAYRSDGNSAVAGIAPCVNPIDYDYANHDHHGHHQIPVV
jgi:hypothetical protein